ncbi:MAG: HIT domain-containing protein [Proteobacteria bacterium]|nr:HIT domain-containing protein [Pseudomonadota bacterium]
MSETIFDKILARSIPAQIIFEDDDILAFRDIHPLAKIHILVIPKKKAGSFVEFQNWPAIEVGIFFQKVAMVAAHLGLSRDGFRIVMNTGLNGGQTVDYAHVHILGGESLSGGFA